MFPPQVQQLIRAVLAKSDVQAHAYAAAGKITSERDYVSRLIQMVETDLNHAAQPGLTIWTVRHSTEQSAGIDAAVFLRSDVEARLGVFEAKQLRQGWDRGGRFHTQLIRQSRLDKRIAAWEVFAALRKPVTCIPKGTAGCAWLTEAIQESAPTVAWTNKTLERLFAKGAHTLDHMVGEMMECRQGELIPELIAGRDAVRSCLGEAGGAQTIVGIEYDTPPPKLSDEEAVQQDLEHTRRLEEFVRKHRPEK